MVLPILVYDDIKGRKHLRPIQNPLGSMPFFFVRNVKRAEGGGQRIWGYAGTHAKKGPLPEDCAG